MHVDRFKDGGGQLRGVRGCLSKSAAKPGCWWRQVGGKKNNFVGVSWSESDWWPHIQKAHRTEEDRQSIDLLTVMENCYLQLDWIFAATQLWTRWAPRFFVHQTIILGSLGIMWTRPTLEAVPRGRPGEGAEMDHTKIKESYQIMICATWKVTIGGCDIRLAGLLAYIAPVCRILSGH